MHLLPYTNILFFFFNDTATTEIYTLSLHDALPIFTKIYAASDTPAGIRILKHAGFQIISETRKGRFTFERSEEHTSELQSRPHLVCRLLLEKKKKTLLRNLSTSN